jgi:outer membrane protein insertion porin family
VGLGLRWDSRDKLVNTRKGEFHQLNLSSGPGFMQLQGDFRAYRSLRPGLVLAGHLLGGVSWGRPSYLFRYRLGGLDTLRGYKDNRFRGADFLLLQGELRWKLKRWLALNASMDFGDIGDGEFRQLKWTGQAGLRLGLPPDWGQKMRIDLGYGFDQQTFQIQFGEIF